jgi:hypothetical protein
MAKVTGAAAENILLMIDTMPVIRPQASGL